MRYYLLVIAIILSVSTAETYSQIGQDVAVLKFYQSKPNGYYVEVGANDGIKLSNTYLLEKKGWQGICVEPYPNLIDKLKANRKCICITEAAYSKDDEEVIFSLASNDLFAGIKKDIDRHHFVLQSPIATVKTKTLTRMLDESCAPSFIEYLSIDTEGSELEILRGIDFEKYTFGYISIEHNYVQPRRQLMKDLLLSKGYVYHRENQFDDDYIHSSLVTQTEKDEDMPSCPELPIQ